MKNWYNIQNKKDRTEINIFDEIGLFGISYNDFIDDVKAIDTPLDIHINSPGGSVFDGLAIYDALNQIRKQRQVYTYVDGMAASMAGVIMLASDRVHVAENARFMMHDVSGGSMGTAEDLRKTADLMDKEQDKIIRIFSAKMQKSENEIRDLMNEETWYHGQEIIDAGLADVITPSKKLKNTFDIDKYNFKNLKREEMTNEEKTGFFNEMKTMFENLINKQKDEKVKDAFAEKIDVIDEKLEEFNDNYTADFDNMTKQLTAKDAEIEELKAKIATLESKPVAQEKPADPDPTADEVKAPKNAFDSAAEEMKSNKFAK